MKVTVIVISLMIMSSTLSAFTVSGHVQTGSGTAVADVDVDFVDRVSGVNLPLTGDSTNLSGNFSVDVPAGSYNVFYSPLDADHLAGGQQLNVMISSDEALSTVTLEAGYLVQVQAVNFAGVPQGNVDLDFYTGASVKIHTVHDTSGLDGRISTFVPQGGAIYRLALVDLAGRGFADKQFDGVQVLADTNYGPIVVGPSQAVTGRTIRYSDSTPVASVDVDLIDSCGLSLRITGDLTSGSGDFNLGGVADGYYDIYFRPTGLDRKVFKRVGISAPLAFGDVKLGTLHDVTGFVRNSSNAPLSGIDLDFTDQQYAQQILLNNDNTIADGSFLVQPTDGTYTIDFRPPTGSPYAPKTLFDVLVTGNVNLGNIILGNAVFLSGYVRRPDGSPVANATVQAFVPASGREVFITGGRTDTTGFYRAGFEAGTWNLTYSPPPVETTLQSASFTSELVTTDRTKDVTLPLVASGVRDWTLYE